MPLGVQKLVGVCSAGYSARYLPNGPQALVVPRGEPCRHGLPTGVRRFSRMLSAGEDTGGTGSGRAGSDGTGGS